MRAQYEEQLGWAVEEGVDFVIAETNDYVGEALIGLEVCQELGLPAMVTFASVQPDERPTTATTTSRRAAILADRGATRRRPQLLARARRRCCRCSSAIRAAVDVPVAAQPVPYRTSPATPGVRVAASADGRRLFPIQLEPFQCTRFEMADFARRARDIGVDYIGICCGGGAAPRARHGRGARPRDAGQPLLAGDRAPPRARHPEHAGRHESMGGWTGAT